MRNWYRGFQRRWFTVAVLLVLVAVAGIQIANPHSYVSEVVSRIDETGFGPDASFTDLTSVDQLQTNFNRDTGHPRLILLLSPT